MARGGRIDWIDAAKGIGIVLVSFGHLTNGDGQCTWLPALDSAIQAVYLFHMPLFFFLGGFTFNGSRSFVPFVLRKAKTLLVPYYVFSLYYLAKPLALMLLPQVGVAVQSGQSGESPWAQCYDVLVNGTGLWFLWAYFVGEMMVYGITKLTRKRIAYVALGIALIVLADLSFRYQVPSVTLPFQIVKGVQVAGFMLLGIAAKKLFLACKRVAAALLFILAAALFVVFAFPALGLRHTLGIDRALVVLSGQMDLVCGVLASIFLAMLLQRIGLVTHIGRSSISFYAVNAFTLSIGKLVFFQLLHLDVARDSALVQWGVGTALVVFCMALQWLADRLIRRFIPWSIGLNVTRTVNRMPAVI